MKRREFLASILASAPLMYVFPYQGVAMAKSEKKSKEFPFQLSETQWKEKLSAEEFRVLRKEGTEPPRSSPLNDEKRAGVFYCAGCNHPLFSSEAKYESGTGWPSFYEPLNNEAVGTRTDYKLIWPRTEIHCANCGGHLGHVFEDGPKPTGLRYCMNGVAMSFQVKE